MQLLRARKQITKESDSDVHQPCRLMVCRKVICQTLEGRALGAAMWYSC